MSFSQDSGYIPNTVAGLMDLVRQGINTQFGTSYTVDTFVGTNFYKYFYALVQRLQENEVKTSEIVLNLQQYFSTTNETIVRPNTTHPGLFDYFAARGYLVSSKKPVTGDAGHLYVAVDVDSSALDYAATKLAINTILKDCVAAGIVTEGTEVSTITLSNNQSFDWKFNLPNKIPIKLKLTVTTSVNNQYAILTTAAVAALLFANINARYRMGLAFEPQRYFSTVDAPWASNVLLQYSLDGGTTWTSAIYNSNYNDKFTFALSDITVIEV